MLQNLIILSLCIVAIHATGEFTILSSPKSLSFKGNQPLQSDIVGDVLYVSQGNAVAGDVNWSGLNIVDPFNLPKGIIAVTLNGASHSKLSAAGKTYQIEGGNVDESLNGLSAQLEADNEPICDINFDEYEEGVANFKAVIGDYKPEAISSTKYLSSEVHSADKQFLQALGYIKSVGNHLIEMKKSCTYVSIRLSVASVAKAHGEKSEAVNEALELFVSVVKNLNTATQKFSNNEALVVAIVNKSDEKSRSKREVVDAAKEAEYNLAEYYNQDYPVIFNIILWFMVVFGFALLAICYAIGSMDPGRDSIIYRMTSTRMKKDN